MSRLGRAVELLDRDDPKAAAAEAEKAKALSITKARFDRGRYRFHGRVKALAEAARKSGLEF